MDTAEATAAVEPDRSWTPPPGWPAMRNERIREILCAPSERFEMDIVQIGGVATRIWKNAPPTLRSIAAVARSHGGRLGSIYEDERTSYDAWHRAVAALAYDLKDRGVVKGDRVALEMRNLWPDHNGAEAICVT